MNVISFDFDLEMGFAWIIVDGKGDDEMSVQCCLESENDQESGALITHKKVIKMSDCGHDWGICADGNAPAFEFWGEDRCMKALFACAKKAGFDVYE